MEIQRITPQDVLYMKDGRPDVLYVLNTPNGGLYTWRNGAMHRLLDDGDAAASLSAMQVVWAQNQGVTKQITGAYTLVPADGSLNIDTQAAGQTITINDALGAGFGVSFIGPVTIGAGTATVVDKRRAGDTAADAASYLQQIGTIGQTVRGVVLTHDLYWLQGGKA